MTRTAFLPLVLLGLLMPTDQGRALKVGQEWEFAGRPGDPHPTLVIVRIESLPKVGEVVHVSIRGVRIKNPRAPGGYSEDVAHMPFGRAALEGSLTRLAHDSVALPAFQDGYKQWKQARGGAFSIAVREALDFVEGTLRQ
jgi:hypothetical protein